MKRSLVSLLTVACARSCASLCSRETLSIARASALAIFRDRAEARAEYTLQ
jgi:hypothetical protein